MKKQLFLGTRFLFAFLLLGGGILVAREKLHFPALEEYDRKGKLADIRQKTLYQAQERHQQLEEINAVALALGRLPKITDVDEQLLLCMKTKQTILLALSNLEENHKRCQSILSSVAATSEDTGISEEMISYLVGVRRTTTAMMREQVVNKRRLQDAGKRINQVLRFATPPKEFVNANGIKMVLTGKGKDSFYSSATPISKEIYAQAFGDDGKTKKDHLCYSDIRLFTRWLSENEQALYRLPTLSQARLIASETKENAKAMWTSSFYTPKDYVQQNEMQRFGVSMFMIFDPQHILDATRDAVPELPFAIYPEVRFHLATPIETGRRNRWNRLRKKLENE